MKLKKSEQFLKCRWCEYVAKPYKSRAGRYHSAADRLEDHVVYKHKQEFGSELRKNWEETDDAFS